MVKTTAGSRDPFPVADSDGRSHGVNHTVTGAQSGLNLNRTAQDSHYGLIQDSQGTRDHSELVRVHSFPEPRGACRRPVELLYNAGQTRPRRPVELVRSCPPHTGHTLCRAVPAAVKAALHILWYSDGLPLLGHGVGQPLEVRQHGWQLLERAISGVDRRPVLAQHFAHMGDAAEL